jgi:hypothetical protein
MPAVRLAFSAAGVSVNASISFQPVVSVTDADHPNPVSIFHLPGGQSEPAKETSAGGNLMSERVAIVVGAGGGLA